MWWRKKKNKKKEPDVGKAQPVKKRKGGARSSTLPFEMKLLAVEAREEGMGRSEVAQLMGVSTATVDNWSREYRQGGERGLCRKPVQARHRKICEQVQEKIIELRKDNPDHGVRRIRDELRRKAGVEVSAETVRSVVNEAGLGNPPPRSRRRAPAVRRFERKVPNALWQIDIFTFKLKRMYPVYLVGIIDDNSRYIVGWGLFRQQTAEAVMEVVRGAIGQWGAPREILSDNGRQFVAWRGETRFQKVMKQQGIQHVRSAPHHPMTLGKIERFWQTIWREYLYDAVFASYADACQRIGHWMDFYNHQRPHQGIEGACPADRFYGLAEDIETAVEQGVKDNSLSLALGQVPQPPLYLLGQLGETDVRVVRKGEDIEVKIGELVHEVIRMGAPYMMDDAGRGTRQGGEHEVGEDGSGGADASGGAGAQWRGEHHAAVRGVWHDAPVTAPGDGEDGRGGSRCSEAEEAWSQASHAGAAEDPSARAGEGPAAEPARGAADQVRGGEQVHRAEPHGGQ